MSSIFTQKNFFLFVVGLVFVCIIASMKTTDKEFYAIRAARKYLQARERYEKSTMPKSEKGFAPYSAQVFEFVGAELENVRGYVGKATFADVVRFSLVFEARGGQY